LLPVASAKLAREPGTRRRDVARQTGLTERAVTMIVGDLCEAGYLTRHRLRARNFYEVHPELPLRGVDAEGEAPQVGTLLALLGERGGRQGEEAAQGLTT
jgi:hypothetical protein